MLLLACFICLIRTLNAPNQVPRLENRSDRCLQYARDPCSVECIETYRF